MHAVDSIESQDVRKGESQYNSSHIGFMHDEPDWSELMDVEYHSREGAYCTVISHELDCAYEPSSGKPL